MMLWTAGLYAGTEAIMGQVVEPLLYGRSTGLSPFSVVVSATFWTWLWGPIGLILSTPLTLCLVVLGRHVERLEFLDVILGDRPALTPVESFYQRMLAGDPDEARDQAEVLLRDRPLSSYYDEVALKGLQLAANDAARGVLTEAQLERIKVSMQDLIDDLDEHDDQEPETKDAAESAATAPSRSEQDVPKHPAPGKVAADALPPAWRGQAPVLCIAGRGPLDEAAASMLSQLLHKSGLTARVLPHEAASRMQDRHAGGRRRGDGLPLLSGDRRHPLPPPLPPPPPPPAPPERSVAGRPVAGRTGDPDRRPAARRRGRGCLHQFPAGGGGGVPGSRQSRDPPGRSLGDPQELPLRPGGRGLMV